MNLLLKNPSQLITHISKILHERNRSEQFCPDDDLVGRSAVMLLLGLKRNNGFFPEPCLILNKRSLMVRQPGDLCLPGGGIEPTYDHRIARILSLPTFPLAKWPYWSYWKKNRPREARWVSLLLATSLREGFEEMRLNPFSVRFLGPLPSHRLRLFGRKIYPMAGWVQWQQRFHPNWEVEKIIKIPIRSLLNTSSYVRYRVQFTPDLEERFNRPVQDYPCFLYHSNHETEALWGVTFRIVMVFLETVFHFHPPEPTSLPVVSAMLKEDYVNGK